MTQLFIEIRSEEIPARLQAKGAEDFKRLLCEALTLQDLTFTSAEVSYAPRRIALVIEGLPIEKPSVMVEKKGPRVDAPAPAIEGFLKSAGITLEDCERRALPKGEFLFAVTEEAGGPLETFLPAAIENAIHAIPWPHAMRWGSGDKAWIRPIHSLIVLFNGQVLPMTLSFGDEHDIVSSNNLTIGHRFMSPASFPVHSFEDYKDKLVRSSVLVDHTIRRAKIWESAQKLASSKELILKQDEALLDEVTGLVEWPEVLMGQIDTRFMSLPSEILITSMRVHQRYFALETATGELAPFFLFVANIKAPDQGKTITAGNERVLGARLSDADFFWTQDRKEPLLNRLEALKNITFHEDLGSLYHKVKRLEALGRLMAPALNLDVDKMALAARLLKTDLITQMVYEFPELQGIMGTYYAKAEGIESEVAEAIADHYKPRGASDELPSSTYGTLLALADRVDTLVGFFALGLYPTGSKDPFALRRACLGIIRLLENNLDLDLHTLFKESYKLYAPTLQTISHAQSEEATLEKLTHFLQDRLKVYWKDQGLRPDCLQGALAHSTSDALYLLKARTSALQHFIERPDGIGTDLLSAYKRATNILRIEESKDKCRYEATSPSLHLMHQAEESDLWQSLEKANPLIKDCLKDHRFEEAMTHLATLKPFVDAYFNKVTVNADEPALRQNRLYTLASFRQLIENVADFSKVEETIS